MNLSSLKAAIVVPCAFIIGCASSPQTAQTNDFNNPSHYQAVGMSTSCSDFNSQLQELEAERPSMTYKIFNAATAISPASWIVSTAMGTNEERWQMLTGEKEDSLNREIDQLINTCGANTASGPS